MVTNATQTFPKLSERDIHLHRSKAILQKTTKRLIQASPIQVYLNRFSLQVFQTVIHQPRFLRKCQQLAAGKGNQQRINENTCLSNLFLAITVFIINMDCCVHLWCLLAFKIVLNKANFSQSSPRFPSAILNGDIPLDGWLVFSRFCLLNLARLYQV